MTFDQWIAAVDSAIMAQAGIGADDLADFAYYDAYKDGATPSEVARAVLEENGFPFDDDVSAED